ncbi:MAG: Ribulose-phosphate 3-epimerase [Hyphomicrobiaceae bacterium hypho_1]
MPLFDETIKIAPSILSADFANLGAECTAIEAQGCDLVHVDIMDGHFVPDITFGPQTCAALRKHIKTIMDVHLMISPVDQYLKAFADSGADILTVHAEAGPHLDRSLKHIKSLGKKAGVALNPSTPPESIEYVLDNLDLICVMTINPGFSGQSFLKSQIDKIKRLRNMIGSRPIHIEIDGGINPKTAPAAVSAGADILVSGSSIFSGGSVANPNIYGKNIRALRSSINGIIRHVN